MSSLKNRIKKAESKVLGFYTGIPKWCMELAEDRLKFDPGRLNNLKSLKKALEREGEELDTPIDESRFILNKEQADKYALSLHKKYKNYANYQAVKEKERPMALKNLMAKLAKIMDDEKKIRR